MKIFVLLVFVCLICPIFSLCPSSINITNNMQRDYYSVSSVASVQGFRIYVESSTGAVHHVVKIVDGSSNIVTLFRKWLSDGNVQHEVYYGINVSFHGIEISSDDQTIYAIVNIVPWILTGVSTSDGSLVFTKSMTTVNTTSLRYLSVMNEENLISLGENSSGFYFIIRMNLTDYVTTTYEVESGNYYGIHALDSSKVMIINAEGLYRLKYSKLNLSTNSQIWSNNFGLVSGTSNRLYSNIVYDSNSDYITVAQYYDKYLFLLVINETDGSLVRQPYRSANTIQGFRCHCLINSTSTATSYLEQSSTNSYFLIHSFVDGTYRMFMNSYTQKYISHLDYDPVKAKYRMIGYKDTTSVLEYGLLFESLPDHTDFTENSSYTLDQIDTQATTSSYTYVSSSFTISSDSSSATNDYTLTSPSGFSITSSITPYNSSVLFFLDSQSNPELGNLVEKWKRNVSINLTCSTDTSMSLVHQIEQYRTYPLPHWVSLDQTNNQLMLDIPEVNQDSTKSLYYFQIKTHILWSTNYYYQYFSLTVKNCQAENCLKCQQTDYKRCHTCFDGYKASSGGRCKLVGKIADAQTTTQSAVGASVGFSAIISIINMTSPVSIWAIINQFQLFLLLLISGAYIPTATRGYLSGMQFVQFDYSFLHILDCPGISDLAIWMSSETSHYILSDIGANYSSAFINNLSFFIVILLTIGAHLIIKCVYKKVKKKSETTLCTKIITKVYAFLTFGIYIRLMLEGYQFMLLTTTTEMYDLNTDEMSYRFSLYISYLLFGVCFVFIAGSCYQYYCTIDETYRHEYAYSSELFSGLKDSKVARTYTLFLMLRRLILVLLIVNLQDFNFIYTVVLMNLVQLAYFVIIIISRPFASVKDNLIEISNECYFTILASMLIYYNTKDRWSSNIEDIFMYTVTLNSLTVVIISFAALVVTLCSKCSKSKKVTPEIINENTAVSQNNFGRSMSRANVKDRKVSFVYSSNSRDSSNVNLNM